ncbi:diacylglycerol O-acyltransferase [Marmoricola sp. OAE513]|uniref:wax ester/triacylglycerol synthase domain-containing protein n=1 Tax=Marmoricola sp. OAE513 TaxID=2817894 RepID=UPI001AE4F2D5
MSAERINGEDGLFLRFERPDTYTHTLKVLVLDPARHGAQVTLEDLHRVVGANLHLSPRATQRVGRLPGKRAWAWVPDENFDLAHHLEEVTAPGLGDRAALDQVCAEVLVRQLDRAHPLWAMTLVHGLEGGRQAVVVRVHHAISDGKASINMLYAASTASPDDVRQVPERTTEHAPVDGRGRFAAFRRASKENKKKLKEFGPVKDLPTLSRRTAFNAVTGKDRLCASTSLDFEDLREIARGAGLTVNGAFHGVVAGAMRRELLDRGFPVDAKLIAAFGVADGADPGRRFGNAFATSFAFLHADVEDPWERLHAAAENARRAIALRAATGFEYYRTGVEFQQYVLPHLRAAFANITPIVGNQITLANVPGPTANRWFGDVELVDWISQAIAIAPSVVSLTGYSYAGRLSLGLTVAPEAVPDPAAFLDRFRDSMEELLELVRSRESQPQPAS